MRADVRPFAMCRCPFPCEACDMFAPRRPTLGTPWHVTGEWMWKSVWSKRDAPDTAVLEIIIYYYTLRVQDYPEDVQLSMSFLNP